MFAFLRFEVLSFAAPPFAVVADCFILEQSRPFPKAREKLAMATVSFSAGAR